MFALLFCVPVTIYILCWVAHIKILKYHGEGDGYLAAEFVETRVFPGQEAPSMSVSTLLHMIALFQTTLYESQKSNIQPHGSMSNWWSWPWMVKGMGLWGQQPDDVFPRATIYMLGNPFVWWTTTAAFYYFVFWLFALPFRDPHSFLSADERGFLRRGIVILGAYFCNWIPYMFVPRTTFLYHYLPILYSGLLLFGLVFDHLCVHAAVPASAVVAVTAKRADDGPEQGLARVRVGSVAADAALGAVERGETVPVPAQAGSAAACQWISADQTDTAVRTRAFGVLALGSLAMFVYFAPHTYGLVQLSREQRESMRWLPYWR
eukprot:TRINITY_DN403_c0_g1_i5.p1 TRINITY_DN403_c0_g1~~TRINITY_DN403_c0_g1_i5.p1  ORF type:complete len:320 (-),score=88.93 TRINITY_DN403_c0_g1_i5:23-982(-)